MFGRILCAVKAAGVGGMPHGVVHNEKVGNTKWWWIVWVGRFAVLGDVIVPGCLNLYFTAELT